MRLKKTTADYLAELSPERREKIIQKSDALIAQRRNNIKFKTKDTGSRPKAYRDDGVGWDCVKDRKVRDPFVSSVGKKTRTKSTNLSS